MRPFMVVQLYPVIRDLPYLIEIAEQIKIQHIFSIGSIESFNKTILKRFARLDKVDVYLMLLCPRCQLGRRKLWPVVTTNAFGITSPCCNLIEITGDSISELISMPSTSRLKSSTTLKVLNRWPCCNTSLIKSIDQHTFVAGGTFNGSGCLLGKRRFAFLRLFSFSCKYTR